MQTSIIYTNVESFAYNDLLGKQAPNMESRFDDSAILDTKDKLTLAIEGGLILVINVAAFTGNLLLCFVMFKKPRFHTAANTLILSLSICHVFTSCLVIPFTAGLVVVRKWPFGQVLCNVQGLAFLILTWVSPQLLTIMTVSRCFKVAQFAIHSKCFSLNRSIGMIMAIFVLNVVVLIIPISLSATPFKFSAERSLLCSLPLSYENRNVNITNAVITLALYMTLLIASILAWRAIKREDASIGYSLQVRRRIKIFRTRANEEERKSDRVLVALTTEVLLFRLPLTILSMVEFPTEPVTSIPRRVHLAFALLWFAVPVLHPVTYMAFYKPFSRKVPRDLLGIRLRQNKVHAEQAM